MQPQSFGAASHAIDVVIVNWNSGMHLKKCVFALQQIDPARACVDRVVIVDNASSDGSCSFEMPPELGVEILYNRRNLGFAAACNQGAAQGHASLLLFLNPDIELEPDTLAGLGHMLLQEADNSIGIIGVQLVNGKGRLQHSCARFPTPASMLGQALGLDRVAPWLVRSHFMTDWNHNDTRMVDQVIGAFMLMRRDDFVRLGGFDERFFLYMEDVDLAVRARSMGLNSLYVHDRRARHAGGGTTEQILDIRLAYLLRSRILYARKHFGRFAVILVTAINLVLEPALRACHAVARGRASDAKAALKAARLVWQRYPFRREDDLGEIMAARHHAHRK